jgi:hypothetical protein
VAQIQYSATKASPEPGSEHGTLGLFFADQPAPKLVTDLVLEAKGEVPASTASQKFRAGTRLTSNIDALALRIESQPGVRSIEVSARKPDGTTTVMLFEKNIRADWPTPYIFKDPVSLPAGAEIFAVAYYANTSNLPQPGGIRATVTTSQKSPSHK